MDYLLHRLSEPRRVLLVAAHPDDEDTGLLTVLARGAGASVAYLALSRGEGGQNLIGAELGTSLGLLRTEELRSARAVDGAAQFFTRAFDFGFTRDLRETEGLWQPDSILKDVVRVVRRFRPEVMVAMFSGTARDGHGQHQMSGVMARRAFSAAADSAEFPELATEEGLAPWQPSLLYGSARSDRSAPALELPQGGLDPASGRTFFQIAMASRSQHRSQDFGVLQRLGPVSARVTLLERRGAAAAATDTGFFAGVPRGHGWLAPFADSLRGTLVPARLADAVPALAGAVARAQRDSSVAPEARGWLEEALATAAGIAVDARAGTEWLVPGDSVEFEIEVYNAGAAPVEVASVRIAPAVTGWSDPVAVSMGSVTAPGAMTVGRAATVVPRGARPTQPYFLRGPMNGAMYDWSAAAPAVRGLPMDPPPLTALIPVRIAGVPVTLRREVTRRYQEQAEGEIRHPLRIVPRVELAVTPDTLAWSSTGPATHVLTVTVSQHGERPVAGTVSLALEGWPGGAPQPFQLARRGETAVLSFTVTRPAGVRETTVTARATARTESGETFAQGSERIAYPHIRPVAHLFPATTMIRLAPIALPIVHRVGYVRGASDRVPEALAQVGLPVTVLGGTALRSGDLSGYDVIVIGSRAYETDSALTASNDRLLAYARQGGHVVVQYQQYPYVNGRYAPYPFDIARPHDRITDERAPVRILDPRHPIFRSPNAIGPGDWDGWPQERGLYFAHTWDAAWTPLLEMQDPGQEPMRGGLLVAAVGRGTFIYTGISFFRALPAGVPGAYRLFMNLLGWGQGE